MCLDHGVDTPFEEACGDRGGQISVVAYLIEEPSTKDRQPMHG